MFFDGKAWANIGSQLKLHTKKSGALELLYPLECYCLLRYYAQNEAFSTRPGMGHNDYVNKSNHINERNARTWMETDEKKEREKKKRHSMCFFSLISIIVLGMRRQVERGTS